MTTSEVALRRVIVVDDDAEVRGLTAEYLRTHGLEVIEAANGLEALLSFKRSRPAAVVLDLCMPRLGGLDALKRMVAFDPAVHVVVVTGEANADLRRQAVALGAKAALAKPVALPDLLAALGLPPRSSALTTSATGDPASRVSGDHARPQG
jgi:CheY-like chemotaxis protein